MLQTPQYVRDGRTKFPNRVGSHRRVLGLGENNQKLGRRVLKGRFKGYRIHTVTLEERATCPTTCHHWLDCYGNNMCWAYRADHNEPDFLKRLEAELVESLMREPGVLVRLHVLGDFYSSEYVAFWASMLRQYPTLAVWGYTARRVGPASQDPVGRSLHGVIKHFGDRFAVRQSDAPVSTMATRSIEHEEDKPADAFVCPEQTGRTKSCGTCGACWSTQKNVAFIAH